MATQMQCSYTLHVHYIIIASLFTFPHLFALTFLHSSAAKAPFLARFRVIRCGTAEVEKMNVRDDSGEHCFYGYVLLLPHYNIMHILHGSVCYGRCQHKAVSYCIPYHNEYTYRPSESQYHAYRIIVFPLTPKVDTVQYNEKVFAQIKMPQTCGTI